MLRARLAVSQHPRRDGSCVSTVHEHMLLRLQSLGGNSPSSYADAVIRRLICHKVCYALPIGSLVETYANGASFGNV